MIRQLKIGRTITNRESQAVEKYLQEISKIPMVTQEEEVILAQKIKLGNTIALDRLTTANLRFVVSVAKQYQHQGLPLGDLINEGNLGLIKAAQRYDETKGFKFISYAVWWIRQSIMQALAEQGRIVRLPIHKIGLCNKFSKIGMDFNQKNERDPTTEELAEIMEISEFEALEIISTNQRHTSLDQPITEDEVLSLGDLLHDDISADYGINRESLKKDILRVTAKLPERQRDVLFAYFGIGEDKANLESIGAKYDLSRERARQILQKAIKRLKKERLYLPLKKYLG
jgi:RNA polymerase primary sigma factor